MWPGSAFGSNNLACQCPTTQSPQLWQRISKIASCRRKPSSEHSPARRGFRIDMWETVVTSEKIRNSIAGGAAQRGAASSLVNSIGGCTQRHASAAITADNGTGGDFL